MDKNEEKKMLEAELESRRAAAAREEENKKKAMEELEALSEAGGQSSEPAQDDLNQNSFEAPDLMDPVVPIYTEKPAPTGISRPRVNMLNKKFNANVEAPVVLTKNELKRLKKEKDAEEKNAKREEKARLKQETKDKKAPLVKPPEEQVKAFIDEFKLESLLPHEFSNLNEAQKLKVVQDLKRRIVDLVKSDAQTQYSESLKGETIFKSISKSITKERDLKNLEKKVFEELKNSQEGTGIIAEDLKRLTEIATEQEVFILGDKGKAYVRYLDGLDLANLTQQEALAITDFNQKAFEFTQMPYEWGQELKGVGIKIGDKRIGNTHKREFEKAKTEYKKALDEVLKIKASREKPDEKGKAMLEVLELDSSVQMEQLLNTHPEFEKSLNEFTKSGNGKDVIKNFGSTITGKNFINRMLMAGGFATRIATVSILGFLTAPIVGACVGGIRGSYRGKETLLERSQQARRGLKDENAEALNIVDAQNLNKRIETLLKALNDASASEEKEKRLDQLKRRIRYTQERIEGGYVNFGDSKKSLSNQYNLLNNLNNALVASASLEETTRKDIDERLNKFLFYKHEKISEARSKFIKNQMLKGMALGAGLAFAGYLTRYFGEHLGWWGNVETGTSKPESAERFMERAEKWMSKMTEDIKNRFSANENHEQEVQFTELKTSTDAKTESLLDAQNEDIPKTTDSVTTPDTEDTPGVVSEKIEVNPEAIIGKGEGIEHALRRQIEGDPELAKYLGYKEGTDLHKFSGGAAHRMALDHGYVDKATGEEIRIKAGDRVAYEIKMENGQPVVNERMVDGTLREGHGGESEFEKDIEKDYEYKYSKPKPAEKTADLEAFEKKMEDKMDERIDEAFEKLKTERTGAISDLKTEISEPVKEPTIEEVRATVLEKMKPAPEPRPNIVTTGTNMGTGYNPTPGQTVGGTNINYHGNSFWPQSGGMREYAYPDLSPENNIILSRIQEAHPEFSSNYYDLSGTQMLAAYDAHGENIYKIFPENTDIMWGKFKTISAQEIMFTNPENAGKEMKPLVSYINKLKELSDLKPKGTMLGLRRAETSEHFIVRAMQKIATQPGKLAELKASL